MKANQDNLLHVHIETVAGLVPGVSSEDCVLEPLEGRICAGYLASPEQTIAFRNTVGFFEQETTFRIDFLAAINKRARRSA